MYFFFSSRRRHTRCALVTGVQTCALPIWWGAKLFRYPNFTHAVVTDLLAAQPKHWRRIAAKYGLDPGDDPVPQPIVDALNRIELEALREEIGRASCRERVCQYV